jgi:ABC-2 type transport system permease protein
VAQPPKSSVDPSESPFPSSKEPTKMSCAGVNQNRALLRELVRTDFKLRYQGSALGYAWSLLRPLVLFAILYLVFARFLRLGAGIPHYPVYLLLGLVVWNFFLETTTRGLGCIVDRADLIRKIRIPRWIIVLSSSLGAVINLVLNLCVVAIFMFASGVSAMATVLWLPLILLEIYVLALGVAFFLSALFVRFRDVSYVWELVVQAGFYATPVLYPVTLIHNLALQKVVMLSPLAQSIQDARYAVVTHQAATLDGVTGSVLYEGVPLLAVFAALLVGVSFFRSESKYFAENI